MGLDLLILIQTFKTFVQEISPAIERRAQLEPDSHEH